MKKSGLLTVCELLISTIIFVMACHFCNYLYVKYDPWPGYLSHTYYDQTEIDNVFVGSSHVMCDVNPELMEKSNGMSNFNLSSAGQGWDVSYFLLKDAIKRYHIKNAYLECWYPLLIEKEEWNEESHSYESIDRLNSEIHYANNWSMSYWMQDSICSNEILLSTMDTEHAIETLFPFARYKKNLFEWDYIYDNIQEKKGVDLKSSNSFYEIKASITFPMGFGVPDHLSPA